jgi:hypothetical protein
MRRALRIWFFWRCWHRCLALALASAAPSRLPELLRKGCGLTTALMHIVHELRLPADDALAPVACWRWLVR